MFFKTVYLLEIYTEIFMMFGISFKRAHAWERGRGDRWKQNWPCIENCWKWWRIREGLWYHSLYLCICLVLSLLKKLKKERAVAYMLGSFHTINLKVLHRAGVCSRMPKSALKYLGSNWGLCKCQRIYHVV